MSEQLTEEPQATKGYAEGESYQTGAEAAALRREALIEWTLTPEDMREPKSIVAFARLWGVSRQRIYQDMREPNVQRQIADRARAVAKVQRLPEVLDSLYRIATGVNADGKTKENRFGETVFPSAASSVSAATALLSWMKDTQELREGKIDFGALTDEELTEAVLTLLNKRSDAEG